MGEDLIIHWAKEKFISLRLLMFMEPDLEHQELTVQCFHCSKLANKPYTVLKCKQTRDFTYVSDVVNAFIKASRSKLKNEILNVGSGKTISVLKIIELLKGKKIHIKKRPGEPDCTFANINKIKQKLNWKPKININQGVELLLNDISYWKKAPVWTSKKINNATKLWFKHLK